MSSLIHVVDDDASFRSSISRLLRISGYRVAEYDSAEQILGKLPSMEPGCILLDIQMRHRNGLELQQHLHTIGFPMPIIFLSGQGDIPMSVRAMKAGAVDFLSKPVSKKDLLAAIQQALEHYRDADERQTRLKRAQKLLATLTPRENQVFGLVVHGALNKQIAHELGTTERTVKAHRQKVMQKLQVKSLAALVVFAERFAH